MSDSQKRVLDEALAQLRKIRFYDRRAGDRWYDLAEDQ